MTIARPAVPADRLMPALKAAASPMPRPAMPGPRPAMPGPRPAPAADQASQLRDLVRRREAIGAPKPAAAARPATPIPDAPGAPAMPAMGPRARVIAITSGKGGVGKSNLAVNLAARFARAGKRTLLLDADMGLANADVLCGMNLRLNLAHVIARRSSLDDIIALAPGGFGLIGGASGLAKMADLPEEEHRRLLGALAQLERTSDLILIDTGAGISRNVLSFTAAADHVMVVTTPEPTAIADAYAMIKVISRQQQRQGPRPISLVVNQVKSAAEARAVYERMAKVAQQFLGLTLGDAGFMPADPAVSAAVRNRTPFILASPKCPASVCVTRLAMRLEAGLAPAPLAPGSPQSLGFFAAVAKLVRPQLAPGFP